MAEETTSTSVSRRHFLAGSPVAALSAASALASAPVMIMAEDDPVFAGIMRHKAALAAFTDESDRQDDLDAPTAADTALYSRLSQAECDALMELADTTPSTEKGASVALAYLLREGDRGRYGELFETFAQSLIAAKWSA